MKIKAKAKAKIHSIPAAGENSLQRLYAFVGVLSNKKSWSLISEDPLPQTLWQFSKVTLRIKGHKENKQ